MSTEKSSLPCGDSDCAFCWRRLSTMAVEDREARKPYIMLCCHVWPVSTPRHMNAPTVSTTCAVPPTNTGRFRRMSSSPDISRPMENSSRTTPISASSSTAWGFWTSPRAVGPHRTPVSRNPTMGGILTWWQTSRTPMERQKMATMSGRRGMSIAVEAP